MEDLAIREPVIDTATAAKLPESQMNQEWRLLTEVVKQEMLDNEELRNTLVSFAATPVSEQLPIQAMDALRPVSSRLDAFFSRYDESIGEYLRVPPVPDEHINPDIQNAITLQRVADVENRLQDVYPNDEEAQQQRMQDYHDRGTFQKGIAKEERTLVAQRYAFARDIKMLALGAALLQDEQSVTASDGSITLPSGIHIAFDADSEEVHDMLLPHLWEKRRQIKDRVYEISVNESEFILKERKTARHTDTKKGGHQTSRTSAQEFAIGRELQTKAAQERGDVVVRFEKPIGFVSFPDGFQFSLFEFEPGLKTPEEIREDLEDAIHSHRNQFESEYQHIQEQMTLIQHAISHCLKETLPETVHLTFEDFAKVKSLRWQRDAENMLRETILTAGFSNSDVDGYALRIRTAHEQLQLEVIGFDFEYYSHDKAPESIADRVQQRRTFSSKFESAMGIGSMRWSGGEKVTATQELGYFALLKDVGMLDTAPQSS